MPVADLTLSSDPELTAKAAASFSDNEVHTIYDADTVMVAPDAMTTSSLLSGSTPPTHVVVVLQSPPAPVLVMVAAHTLVEQVIINRKRNEATNLNLTSEANGLFLKSKTLITREKKRHII
jgi:hypothetical protein